MSESVGYHLSVFNAEYRCDLCSDQATCYLHGVGFRCGGCHPDAPDEVALGDGRRLDRRKSNDKSQRTVG